MRFFKWIQVLALGLIVSCAPVPVALTPIRPQNREPLLAYSWTNIYLASPDGSGAAQVTQLQGANYPDWSPGGEQIAFTYRSSVYLINSDGSGLSRLTTQDFSPGIRDAPAWSPDGRQIAFASYSGNRQGQVYVLDVGQALQGHGDRAVRQINQLGIDAQRVSWSPDGQLLLFYEKLDHHQPYRVGVIRVNNSWPWQHSEARTLVLGARSPVWSPDGKQMLYVTEGEEDREETNIYLIPDAAKSIEHAFKVLEPPPSLRLTDTNSDDWPTWSPDNKQIAFTSKRDGNAEIYVMDADGSNPTRLTNDPAEEHTPTWSPDGKYIAFLSNRDGYWEVYVMDSDGKNVQRLSDNPGDAFWIGLVWQPEP